MWRQKRTVTVCHCEVVGSAAVEAAIAEGATTVEQVTDRCGAGGGCGRCGVTIAAMLERCGVTRAA